MMAEKKLNVLFICIHNSARSQMAEAFLNQFAGDRFAAQSAGLEKGSLNPLAVAVMAELGIDIASNQTKDVASVLQRGDGFDLVITVCDDANAERCPIFPGKAQRMHWSFSDPSALQGTTAEKLRKTREIRDAIKFRIDDWLASMS